MFSLFVKRKEPAVRNSSVRHGVFANAEFPTVLSMKNLCFQPFFIGFDYREVIVLSDVTCDDQGVRETNLPQNFHNIDT